MTRRPNRNYEADAYLTSSAIVLKDAIDKMGTWRRILDYCKINRKLQNEKENCIKILILNKFI